MKLFVCIREREPACECVVICVGVCVHRLIQLQRSRCVCMCVRLQCCDVKILPQRACRRKTGWRGRMCWEKDERYIKQNENCLCHKITVMEYMIDDMIHTRLSVDVMFRIFPPKQITTRAETIPR